MYLLGDPGAWSTVDTISPVIFLLIFTFYTRNNDY